MPKKWTTIPDEHVRHVWSCPEGCGTVDINPTFYGEAGEPMCEQCESEMEYTRTDVLIES